MNTCRKKAMRHSYVIVRLLVVLTLVSQVLAVQLPDKPRRWQNCQQNHQPHRQRPRLPPTWSHQKPMAGNV